MIQRVTFCLISILITCFITTGCNSRSARKPDNRKPEAVQQEAVTVAEKEGPILEKVIFFIENSGSMFGYVNRANEFKNSLVGLAYLPEFDKA
ncbi:MAG: hypothetical protein H6R35_848, partial [Bacteroidetes bacterium]|nr:hypothetical protein [Bacteroidota bacterium]